LKLCGKGMRRPAQALLSRDMVSEPAKSKRKPLLAFEKSPLGGTVPPKCDCREFQYYPGISN
jgi:hypothetical protein